MIFIFLTLKRRPANPHECGLKLDKYSSEVSISTGQSLIVPFIISVNALVYLAFISF
nr:MAG TPA: hypothetical protein [Caudoviricetes sp.]DAW30892.1 MAG TPA: hypothetical protein [Caudoviricetes sp.]